MDPGTHEIPPADVDLAEFAAIIDLRSDQEPSHEIEGSIRIDGSDLDRVAALIPAGDTPILLYCAIGEASAGVAHGLFERGFTGAVSLAGGLRRWASEGRPVAAVATRHDDRYDRHLRLDGFGLDGQRRIRASRMLVVGAGGLGAPVIQYLTAAGVGAIGVVDGDRVDTTNLQRQVLFDERVVGMRKVEAVAIQAQSLNPDTRIEPIPEWFDDTNAAGMIAGYDLVVDASDNFRTRLAVNDAAAAAGVPFVHGAAIRWEGVVAAFEPREGPCYRCLFPRVPDHDVACSDVGVLGAVTGVIGSLMAAEAAKHIIGSHDRLLNRLITYDGRSAAFESLRIEKSERCIVGHP